MIRFNAQPVTLDAAASEDAPRTITGIAVPWDVAANASGTEVKFLRGSFDVNAKPAKLIENHDMTQLRGTVTELVDAEEGLLFTARFARTAAADEAIELVKAGAYDAVSVGATPVKFKYDKDGVMVVSEARLLELSLVPYGAFEEAVITDIAASQEIPSDSTDSGNTAEQTPQEETPNMENTAAPAVEATIPTTPLPAEPKREFKMPSAAEYLAAMHIGGDTFRKVNAAFVEAQKAKQSVLQAAAGDVVTTDTPGLLPIPVLGPVFQDLNYIRPVVAAVGARAYPDGGSSKTFIRPTWTTHTGVAAQSGELSGAGGATTPVIASNSVSKTTLSGTVKLSVQDIDFTSPAAMEIILRDLAGMYLIASDNFCADQIVAQGGASGVTWTFNATDPSDLIDSLYEVAESQLDATNFLPDHLFVSADVWRKLSRQLDVDKRPIFPYAAAAGLMGVNGLGTQNITTTNTLNPLGLNLVVDKNFAAGTMVLARGQAIEFYEQIRGLMSVEDPANLGRQFSYYGYVSTFIADATMVSKITVA